jgi:hypothetical protein
MEGLHINAFECFCDSVKWITDNSWDSPIISLYKMVIWLSDGPVAHSIFEHEYLKYYKEKYFQRKN